MKKHWKWLLVVLLLLLLPWAVKGGRRLWAAGQKAYVWAYVERNREKLDVYAREHLTPTDQKPYKGLWPVSYDEQEHVLVFEVTYYGFGSESTMKGFYYSPDDVPSDLRQGEIDGATPADYVYPADEGMTFCGEGDNFVYTQRITDCWFWFEQHW